MRCATSSARDPQDANALNSLGYMFADRGERLDEAVELLQRALKIEPGNPSFLDSLGWAFFKQGKLASAEKPLAEAAAQMPGNSVVQDHLGDLRFRQQRFADAVAAWERALAGDGETIERADIEKKLREARARAPEEMSAAAPGSPRRHACVLASACGPPPRPALPTGAGAPFAGFAAAYEQATADCRSVSTITAELGLSGRAGGTKLRGRINAGLRRSG